MTYFIIKVSIGKVLSSCVEFIGLVKLVPSLLILFQTFNTKIISHHITNST
jgi:hypothetical protein